MASLPRCCRQSRRNQQRSKPSRLRCRSSSSRCRLSDRMNRLPCALETSALQKAPKPTGAPAKFGSEGRALVLPRRRRRRARPAFARRDSAERRAEGGEDRHRDHRRRTRSARVASSPVCQWRKPKNHPQAMWEDPCGSSRLRDRRCCLILQPPAGGGRCDGRRRPQS